MADDKHEPRNVYVDPETGDLREKGSGKGRKSSGLGKAIKRVVSDAVIRSTSTSR